MCQAAHVGQECGDRCEVCLPACLPAHLPASLHNLRINSFTPRQPAVALNPRIPPTPFLAIIQLNHLSKSSCPTHRWRCCTDCTAAPAPRPLDAFETQSQHNTLLSPSHSQTLSNHFGPVYLLLCISHHWSQWPFARHSSLSSIGQCNGDQCQQQCWW